MRPGRSACRLASLRRLGCRHAGDYGVNRILRLGPSRAGRTKHIADRTALTILLRLPAYGDLRVQTEPVQHRHDDIADTEQPASAHHDQEGES